MIESLDYTHVPTEELQKEQKALQDGWEVARLNGCNFEKYQRKMAMIAFTLDERERNNNV